LTRGGSDVRASMFLETTAKNATSAITGTGMCHSGVGSPVPTRPKRTRPARSSALLVARGPKYARAPATSASCPIVLSGWRLASGCVASTTAEPTVPTAASASPSFCRRSA